MRQSAQKMRSPLKIVAIILAVAVVVIYAGAAYSIHDTSQGYVYDYDARDYLYPAESGRYGDLYDTAIRDMGKQVEYSPEVEECRALAFYYEQAVLEHAYRATGDIEKADAFAARMSEYGAQLGSLSKKAEDVRETVGG